MAPHVGFDVEHIRDKARKDLLYLLEGVRKADPTSAPATYKLTITAGSALAAVEIHFLTRQPFF